MTSLLVALIVYPVSFKSELNLSTFHSIACALIRSIFCTQSTLFLQAIEKYGNLVGHTVLAGVPSYSYSVRSVYYYAIKNLRKFITKNGK